ncbi:hypothetical protein [Luteibacter sp.]|uniref:hypothetical protein n=1 Tax=Luteibacter sp. TaxID=1886636 RepID=UPI0025C517B8|nr:hypothetical protein [Luteibacter sp.]
MTSHKTKKEVSAPVAFAGIVLGIFGVWLLMRDGPEPQATPETPATATKPSVQDAYAPGFYESDDDLHRAFEGFKTFDGRPLDVVLGSIGLHIKSVFVDRVKPGVVDGDRAGDVSYDVTMAGHMTRKVPCANIRPTSKDESFIEEFVRRREEFPLSDETSDAPTGPVLYWAATGKCSKAY